MLFAALVCAASDGGGEKPTVFEFRWHNNVGFGADLSMMTYAMHVAQHRNPHAAFCLNRYREWRFMPCANRTLACLFEPGALRSAARSRIQVFD